MHEELDGQSDEHFGDADLFAGHTGRRLVTPTNDMNESDSRMEVVITRQLDNPPSEKTRKTRRPEN